MDVRMPDGTVVTGVPEDITKAELLARYTRNQVAAPVEPQPDRTIGQAATDIGAGVLTGLGKVGQIPGQLYGLATGDFKPGVLTQNAKALETAGAYLESPQLKAARADRAAAEKLASHEGVWEEFKTTFQKTISNPALLTNFLAETAPQLLPSFLAARAFSASTMAGKELFTGAAREAALKSAGAAGTRAAIYTGAVQQGADIGAQTFKDISDHLVKEGMSQLEADGVALGYAQATGFSAAAMSKFAQMLPGASKMEEAFAGIKGTSKGAAGRMLSAAKTATGEIIGEVPEEVGGKFAQNVAMQQVNPETSLKEGLGSAAAMAMIGGGGAGAATGALSPQGAAPIPGAEPVAPEVAPVTPPPAPPAAPVEPKKAAEETLDNYYTYPKGVEARGLLESIQNETKSPNSIAQMQAIAAKPDYNKVSVSKSEDGAPIVLADTPIPENRMGKVSNVSASDGTEIPIQYAVVEAADLTPSHDASGSPSKDFANKDVESIRPVVGNGRVAGLQQAYLNDTATGYREKLLRDDDHGIDPVAIYTMDHPILVRVMPKSAITPDMVAPPKQEAAPVEEKTVEPTKTEVVETPKQEEKTPPKVEEKVVPKVEETISKPKVAAPTEITGDNDFVVGDRVTVGKALSTVVGIQGDYIKIRPDTATSDKTFHRVLKRQAKLVSRPELIAPEKTEELGTSRIEMGHKEAAKRIPELEAGAKKVAAGEMTRAEYEVLVNKHKRIEPYKDVPVPATYGEALNSLRETQKTKFGDPSFTLKAGARVGIRLDIPAYTNHGVWISTVHSEGKGVKPGTVIGYETSTAIKNPKFVMSEKGALSIAKGGNKGVLAAINGEWNPVLHFEIRERAKAHLKDPEWAQVGMDPERHGYYYDKTTLEPIVSGSEMLQVGPLILVKNPVYAPKAHFSYSQNISKSEENKFGTEAGVLAHDREKLEEILGQNMYGARIVDVSIKELLQNAFDAVKGATSGLKSKPLYKTGHVEITVNSDDRTITVKDDGRGMTADIVRKAFFTVAGSDKSDLVPGERSGGFGLAKMGFLLGIKDISLDTVRDGVRITVDATSKEIKDSNFQIHKVPAPKSEHGTTIKVTIPKTFIDPLNGDARDISFPYDAGKSSSLRQPIIGPAEIKENFTSYGTTKTVVHDVGVNFPEDKYTKLHVKFDWGNADVYYGIERKEYPDQKVLSSGIYQFDHRFKLNDTERVPYDIIVNIKSDVTAHSPDYPFKTNREDFNPRISNDVKSLEEYIRQIGRGHEAQNMQENFEGIVSMPRLEAGKDIADLGKKLKKAFGPTVNKKTNIEQISDRVIISGDQIKDILGKVLIDVGANERERDSSFKADKDAPSRDEFMLKMEQDPKLPIFHNNTNVDFMAIGKEYGDPGRFFAELGTLVTEMKEELAKSGMWKYDLLSPENLFFGGISIDKDYGGVHIRLPYKAIFLNPFYNWGAKTVFGVRENFWETITHEIAHVADMSHGVGHNNEMIKVRQHLADAGLQDYYRDALLDILINHESTFEAMREVYDKSTTRNIAKSLETGGARSSRTPDGGTDTGAENKRGSVQAGRGQGRDEHLPATGGSGGKGGVNQEGRGINEIDDDPARSSASWNSPEPTQLDNIIFKYQNKFIDLKRVQEEILESGATIPDRINVYQKETLYHGATGTKTDEFVNKELGPLMREMKARNVTTDQLETYLHARHAEEANIRIATINPDDKALQDGGSGMSTADAKKYLAGLGKSEKANLEPLAAKVDAMLEKTRQLYVDEKLVSAKQVDSWRNMFKHYIPLMREDHDGGMGVGQGFSIKGKEVKSRTGSKTKVVNILGNIALQRERVITRAGKNDTAKALAGLVVMNPNPEFWTFDKTPMKRELIKAATFYSVLYHGSVVQTFGTNRTEALRFIAHQGDDAYTLHKEAIPEHVAEVANTNYKQADNVVVTKIEDADGQINEHAIIFNEKNPNAMRLARTLKNLDGVQLEGIMATFAAVTRYFASINTQYNPIFGIINLLRDVQGSLINLSSTPLAGKQKEVLSHAIPALIGIYKSVRADRRGEDTTNVMGKKFKEMQLTGGMTGYRDLYKNSDDRSKAIENMVNPQGWQQSKTGKIVTINGRLNVPTAIAQKNLKIIFDWLSDYNLAMEGAIRLSVYQVGLDNGLSKEQSAYTAKNISVNFNRKGDITTQASALFAFFNASMQGTARIAETLTTMDKGDIKTLKLSKIGKRAIAGGLILGSAQAVLLALAGFDDEDPKEFVREKNLILPIGNKKYVMLPMPLGFNAIPNMGRITTEYALGGFKDPGKYTTKVFTMLADTFNPLGSAGFSLQTVAPTAIDPLAALDSNKDWTGQTIAREEYNKMAPTPGFKRNKDVASGAGIAIAEAINMLTFGTDYTPGKLSPTGDQIDYLAGQVTGGIGREIGKLFTTTKSAVTGEEIPVHRIPLVGRFYGDTGAQSSQANTFYSNLKGIKEVEGEVKGRQKDKLPIKEYLAENPKYKLIDMAGITERSVSELRTHKRAQVAAKKPREEIKKTEEKITKIMTMFNNRVRQAEKDEIRAKK